MGSSVDGERYAKGRKTADVRNREPRSRSRRKSLQNVRLFTGMGPYLSAPCPTVDSINATAGTPESAKCKAQNGMW